MPTANTHGAHLFLVLYSSSTAVVHVSASNVSISLCHSAKKLIVCTFAVWSRFAFLSPYPVLPISILPMPQMETLYRRSGS